ncbi:MAG: hypothetical protein G5Z42_01765 [Caldisphaeraceae archaeon]|nr:hypothetical protein [Caldisphaeraceae archaeon]MEB3797533.1 hypothetical protein [Caldisphaeraceae archaeon]
MKEILTRGILLNETYSAYKVSLVSLAFIVNDFTQKFRVAYVIVCSLRHRLMLFSYSSPNEMPSKQPLLGFKNV